MGHEIIETGDSKVMSGSSKKESETREDFFKLYEQCPIPKEQILNNLGLFAKRQVLSRILMMNDMYKKIVNLHGIVCEFGVHWGNNLALFESFRGMYEPYNYNRKIVGFDTFEGFPSVHEKDGNSKIIEKGAYSTTKGYEEYLEQVLKYHESESPIPHIKKFELVKGDASVTIKKYLKDNPETIIAFAYFDFDIYEPTKACLEAILPHLTKGAIIGFDELNFHNFPGETLAFKEVLGINNYKIHRDVNNPLCSYIIYE
ncbi:CalS11 [Fluviicola taffensis DSM 16823]|uniref:CalS11 n=2 Tax=Fluviicola TaxID=332102 RepID=F2IGA0_FLUTR|nr:CalS11 [Fluviicola taffensis DSM 16823]